MLASKRIFIVLILSYMYLPLLIYYSGYEIGILILPFAHAWKHHDYSGRTIYKDFSSTGIYFKAIDNKLNRLWNYIFLEAEKSGNYLYDFMEPLAMCVYVGMIITVPVWMWLVGL